MKKNPKPIMTVEQAIEAATDLWKSGAAPFLIASALLNDNFSLQQTETIMRWAYLKLKREGAAVQTDNIPAASQPETTA